MPWYEFICDKCGKRVARNCSIVYRDAATVHREEDGCGDGRLRRVAPMARAVRLGRVRPPPRPRHGT